MQTRRLASALIAVFATVTAVTFHLPTAAAAPSVFGLRYMASSYTSTTVSWFKAADATSYKVYVNGTLARTVTNPELTTTIELPQLLGPKDDVTAEAVAADGTVGERMKATYRYLYAPYDGYIPAFTVYFVQSSADLGDEAESRVQEFIAELKNHGFADIRLIGHNSVAAGTYNALTMASLRAEHVAAQIAATVTVPTDIQAHGIAVPRGVDAPDANRRVEVFFR